MARFRLPTLPQLILLILLTVTLTRFPLVSANFWLNLGAIQFNQALARPTDGLAAATACLVRSQPLPAGQRLLGFVQLAEQQPATAIQTWRAVPGMAAELARWGWLRRPNQTSWFGLAAAVDPSYQPAQLAYCNELLESRAFLAVRELYLEVPAAQQATPGLLVCAGAAELALGEAEQAVALLEAAVAEAPERAAYWQWYSLALTRTGRFADAITASEQATRLAPAVADYWEHLGNLYRDSEQWALAQQAYEKAITLAPDNDRARAALAALAPAP
ncbi:MAG: tetratricopeptide repeat protein [Anaerolineales bacterium]|nr:tetratricopeptide repeat protein [Anaerolineales bacterium]